MAIRGAVHARTKIEALEMELSDAYKKSYSRDAPTPPTTQEQPKEQNPHDDPTLLQVDKTRLEGPLNDALQQLRRHELESARAVHASNERIVALERGMLQLAMEKKTIEEEQTEERALIRDLQQINREFQVGPNLHG